MLDEKKVMSDKLLTMTLFSVAAGILIGIGLCMCGFSFVLRDAASGVIGGILIILGSLIGHMSDKVKKEINDYIQQPYVNDLEKELENVDSATDIE